MLLYTCLLHMFLIIKCRAREDELVSVDDVISRFIKNVTRMNLDLLHSVRDAHKNIGDMKTHEIIALDSERNEIGNDLQKHDRNLHFLNTLVNDEPIASIEAITFDPRTKLNALNILRNIFQLYKRTIPEKHLNQWTVKEKLKNNVKTKQVNNIWKTLPIKLNTLIHDYDENLSFKISKEDTKPLIIVLTNSDKRESNEIDTSDIKEIEHKEQNQAFLRDGCVTCVQAQLKRCYKALKQCTKTTCATYNCKSSFKKAFKANSKKACIAEFWREEDSKIGNKRNISAVIYVNHPDTPPRITRTFVDLNLGCEDEEDDSYPRSIEELLNVMNAKTTGHRNVNVLRNKYDKACKKAVAKKCNKVCIAVITKTCEDHKCMKRQIKSFKKDCKKSCATVFGVSKSSDDSSDSSDEEDEEDEEDESD